MSFINATTNMIIKINCYFGCFGYFGISYFTIIKIFINYNYYYGK